MSGPHFALIQRMKKLTISYTFKIQQGAGATVKYAGPLDCGAKLIKEGGIRSIYKGTCATLLRGEPSFPVRTKLLVLVIRRIQNMKYKILRLWLWLLSLYLYQSMLTELNYSVFCAA